MKYEKTDALISVVVPIYNVEDYLPKCIESICNQYYSKLQIILVDDGSTDKSGEICNIYKEKDSRIEVIHKNNEGLVSARKTGIRIAQGEYVGFVDGDDWIEPHMYQNLYNAICRYPMVEMVHSGLIREYSNGNKIYQEKLNPKGLVELDKSGQELLNSILSNSGNEELMLPSIYSKLFRKDSVRKVYDKVPDSQSMGEDLICLCASLLEFKRIYILPEAYYHYRMREGSISKIYDCKKLNEIYTMVENVKAIIKEYGFEDDKFELISAADRWLCCAVAGWLVNYNKKIYIEKYFFPNEKKIIKKRIIIYGAGKVGENYYSRFTRMVDCNVVAWVDSNTNLDNAKVEKPENILLYEYDFIIIAVLRSQLAKNILENLQSIGIEKEKIIWEMPKAFF